MASPRLHGWSILTTSADRIDLLKRSTGRTLIAQEYELLAHPD
jgi:hypothetical protein